MHFISVRYFLFMLTTHRHYDKIWRIDNFETEVTLVKKREFFPFRSKQVILNVPRMKYNI